MPETMTVLTPSAIDDESENEENLDLDLHVSDTENNDDVAEDIEKVASDIPMEIEDEILNKFESSELAENAKSEKSADKITSEEKTKDQDEDEKESESPTTTGEAILNEDEEDKLKIADKKEADKTEESKKVEEKVENELSDAELDEELVVEKSKNEDTNEIKSQNEDSNETKLQSEDSNEAKSSNEDSNEPKSQNEDSNEAKLANEDSNEAKLQNEESQESIDLKLQDSNESKSQDSIEDKLLNEDSSESKLQNEDEVKSDKKSEEAIEVDPLSESKEKASDEDVILEDDDMELEDMPEKSEAIVTHELKVNGDDKDKKDEKLLNGDSKEKNEDDKTASDTSEKDEGEDLLLVMDEKTAEESDFNEDSKEKDPISQEEESNEESTETPPDDEAMDIEENVDDIDIEEHDTADDNEINESDISSDNLNTTVIEKVKSNEKKDGDEEDVKTDIENLETDEKEQKKKDSFLKAILTNVKCADEPTKSVKRQLSDPESGEDVPKKPKLLKEEEDEKKPELKELKKLGALKQFMLDKSLKGFTRDHLEMLCIQKMCECIVQKSEIGELKLKIRMHEQLIDSLRKETVMLSKQTRDLHIVHTKVAHDLTKIQENSSKPLIVPKITRSVGLQAVVRDELRRRMMKSPVPLKQPPKKVTAIAPAANSTTQTTKSPAITRTYTSPTKQQQGTPVRIVQQQNKPKMANSATNSPAKPTDNKGVIDLTDEDDKVTTTTSTTTTPAKTANGTVPINGTKVNMINAPNGHKFVVMPNGQTVMVKLSTAPVVVSQQGQSVLRGQSPMNGTARPMNNMIRPVRARTPIANQIRAKTTTVTSNQQQRSATTSTTPQQQRMAMKHPAPLPPPPPPPKHCNSMKPNPPKPQLMLNKTTCGTGIILSWKMPYKLDMFEDIASYQLYAYQETKSTPKTDSWGKIGDVKALELPMAVTLTQFAVGNRYYFAVRAVDVLSRHGPFSEYQTILL